MNESQEILRRALDLSLAVYRLTERLPKGEILAWQLRKLGNEIIGDLVDENFKNCRKKIELLLIYFEISQAQSWVREINWLVLKNEYQKLCLRFIGLAGDSGKERQKEENKTRKSIGSHNIEGKEIKKAEHEKSFNSRQEKIIEHLTAVESLKMAELSSLFKDSVSERTLRNDLQVLLKSGVLNKSGTNKTTKYFLSQF